jgi:vitamin B12 transporter
MSLQLLPRAVGTVARIVVCIVSAFSTLASAQPSGSAATALPEVVVTGSRTPTPLTESLADVSVVTRQQLETAGQSSLVDVLRRLRGIEFTTNGGPGSVTALSLRGSSNPQVLVLIDGQRVGSSTAGGASWSAIPVEHIERVEILRGPASSLYGADAIGGVVQIFTRQGDGPMRFSAEGGVGSYDTWRIGAGVSGSADRLRYSVRAGREDSGGFNAIRNPAAFGFNPDRDGYRAENASGQLGFTLARGQELGVQYLENRIKSQYDTSPSFDDRTTTTLRAGALTSTTQILANWTSRLRFGETADLTENRSEFGTSRFDTKQRQYAWQNDFTFGAAKLQLAAERREERVISDTLFSTNQRDTNSGVAVLQWTPGRHLFQASGRHDDSNQFGGRTTGALAYGYRLGGGWRATVSFGTAFRAPTFNDLYFPGFDNPNLAPEKARNAEAGLYYDHHRGAASAVYYRNRVEDLIAFSGVCPLPGRPFGCPVNVNRALLEGVSLSAQALLSAAWVVRGTLDIAEPKDRGTGNVLPRRAQQYGGAAVDYTRGALRLTTELVASGRRFDNVANTQRMGGYSLWNIVASYQLTRQWSVFARWNNVFDKQYELASNFATPGSNVFIGVRCQ